MNPGKNMKAYLPMARYCKENIAEARIILGTGGIKRRSLSRGK